MEVRCAGAEGALGGESSRPAPGWVRLRLLIVLLDPGGRRPSPAQNEWWSSAPDLRCLGSGFDVGYSASQIISVTWLPTPLESWSLSHSVPVSQPDRPVAFSQV